MNQPGQVIAAALGADATVTQLAGDRIFPNVLREGATLPAVVYTAVSQVPQNSMTGTPDGALFQSRMQVDCYARTYAVVQQLAAAVYAVLGALSTAQAQGVLEAQRDLYENESQLHRVSMDFSIWS